jgi:hypothetical protein
VTDVQDLCDEVKSMLAAPHNPAGAMKQILRRVFVALDCVNHLSKTAR